VGGSGADGIVVLEGAPAGEPIPLVRETVAAFVGPAPRGPVNIPVAIRSVAEYLRRFGTPDQPSRLEQYLSAFFDNGGTLAVVVRVSRSERRNRLHLPSGPEEFVLEALHPGPLEYLRASVDYDQVAPGEGSLFNLVIHRLDSGSRAYVAEQEIYRRVSADPSHPDFVGHALLRSQLLRLVGDGPGRRPDATIGPTARARDAWVHADHHARSGGTLTDYDLIGSVADGTGLHALEQAPIVDLLCLLSPSADSSLGPVARFAAERYCQRRNAILLLPPPWHCRSASDVLAEQVRQGLASPNVLTWFPDTLGGSVAGAIAGALAAADGRGDATPPNLSLRAPARPEQRLTLMESASLQRAGVNTLVAAGAGRLALAGGLTLARAGGMGPEWHDLKTRRRMLRILGGVTRASRWALFIRDDRTALDELRAQLTSFLDRAREAGWLMGNASADAWFLDCPGAGDAQAVTVQLGLAPRRAGEFLAFRIEHTSADTQLRELGWQPALALAS
jgi:hypothetical protein